MPDLAMLDYFYGDEAEQFTFYRIPKVLFTDPSYRRISSDAKILYGLMLDRMGLSVRNGWLDEYNRVFIFFTLEDALEYLCCGHTKAVSLFGELDKAGLIERKKQGQGKPTKIYVKNFVRNAEVLTSEKRKSKVPQSGSQDFQKTASNNTEIKDTELSDTEPSIHPARGLPEDKSPAADAMDTMRVYRQIIMENIEYDITRRQLGYDADILDEIVDIMVDTVCSTKPMIRIGGQDFPLEVVKSRLLKLNSEHISYVVSSLKSNTTKVRNIRAYLLTALYNAPTTISSYYTALVNHTCLIFEVSTETLEQTYERIRTLHEIQEALNEFTPKQRRRFLLHFAYGYTYMEIAKMEGSNKSTVMRSAKVALKKIQKKLAA